MALDTFACPECGVKLRRSPNLTVGARVQCPKCRIQFLVPPEEEDPASGQPREGPDKEGYGESPAARAFDARHDDPDDRAVSTGTRRADDPPPVRPPARYDDDYDRPLRRFDAGDDEDYPRYRRGDPSDLSNDYQVNVGRWFSLARQHYGALALPAAGYEVVAQIISNLVGLIPGIGGLLSILVNPPLEAGPTVVSLAQLKGDRWSFGDFFGGFKFYGQTVGLAILQGLAVGGALLPGVLVGVIALVAVFAQAGGPGGGGGPPPVVGVLIFAGAVLASVLAAAYVGVRLTFFALPLILDRGFGVSEAMGGSWRLTRGHFLGLFGVSLILWLILFLPLAVLGGSALLVFIFGLGVSPDNVGASPIPFEIALLASMFIGGLPMVFTIPYTKLVMAAAYLDVAGTRPPVGREEAERRHDEDYRDRY